MERKKYTVVRGIEHPVTGHWLPSGAIVELTGRQACILTLNGHVKVAGTTVQTTKKSKKQEK
jgi:hypothetical protein